LEPLDQREQVPEGHPPATMTGQHQAAMTARQQIQQQTQQAAGMVRVGSGALSQVVQQSQQQQAQQVPGDEEGGEQAKLH
jgi:hypothetical protein